MRFEYECVVEANGLKVLFLKIIFLKNKVFGYKSDFFYLKKHFKKYFFRS